MEPSTDSSTQPPGTGVVLVRHRSVQSGPIVSRSHTSFVFNDVVGLDLFFFNTYEQHTLTAMNIVCWGTGLQPVIPLRDQSGETLRNVYGNNWLRSHGKPRILVVDQQRRLCSGTFAEKVDSDGTTTGSDTHWKHHGGIARQSVQERIGRKTITRQHKTAPKHRRGRILKRTLMP